MGVNAVAGVQPRQLTARGVGGALAAASSSTWAQDTLGITIKVVPRPKDAKGFVLLLKRWVVERSNSWTMRARRNARDYERLMSHAEAHIQWAFITLMSRRLARPRREAEASTVTLAAA
jgi:transposase